jgi:hypothetical protein
MTQANLTLASTDASAAAHFFRTALAAHDSGNPAVLALDLGTTTGWALHTCDSRIISGTMSFRPSRYEGNSAQSSEWRDIPGWPEYQVSQAGEVRRAAPASGTAAGRVLKQYRNKKTGYFSVCLSRNCIQSRIDVHRLVAFAFHGPQPSADHVVAHNDGCRTNNRCSNLRWATQSENLRGCREHGTALLGSRNPSTRIDEIDAQAIRRMKAAGIPRRVIAEGYGLHKRTVFKILSGASWGHMQ